MKVILINPVSMLIEKSEKIRNFLKPIPPLGLAYIASVLEKGGIEVVIIDQFAEKMDNDALVKAVILHRPDVVAFSCLTPTIKNTLFIIEKIKALKPETRIVLGNIHPTLFSKDLLESGLVDAVVRGEGEYSMLELMVAFREGRNLEEVKGVSFIKGNKVYHNPDREPVKDLDTLPYPAWHLLDLAKYDYCPLVGLNRTKFLPILASRGCPYQCVFCAQEKIHKKIRYRKTKDIVDEIENMHNSYGISCFAFNDPFFPFSIQQGLEFCDEIFSRGLEKKIKWIAESRVDKVNLELLKKMKRAGAYLIMYGFEVGTQKILDTLKKDSTLEQSLQAMEFTKKAGLYTLGLFMLGAPGETKEDCEETIRFSKKLDCTIAKFNIVVPYPGTALFDKCKTEFDLENSERFMSWLDWSPQVNYNDMIYVSDTMDARELVGLQRKAMFQFYFRPRSIVRHIKLTPFRDLCVGGWLLVKQQFKSLNGR